eukprot:365130-Chlamydomonas_euryale.AAC.38
MCIRDSPPSLGPYPLPACSLPSQAPAVPMPYVLGRPGVPCCSSPPRRRLSFCSFLLFRRPDGRPAQNSRPHGRHPHVSRHSPKLTLCPTPSLQRAQDDERITTSLCATAAAAARSTSCAWTHPSESQTCRRTKAGSAPRATARCEAAAGRGGVGVAIGRLGVGRRAGRGVVGVAIGRLGVGGERGRWSGRCNWEVMCGRREPRAQPKQQASNKQAGS